MQTTRIQDLTNDQRDQWLSQLLAEKAEMLRNTPHTPESMAGKATLQIVKGMLLDHLADGHIHDAISEATQSVELAFDDFLWDVISEESFEVAEVIETALLSQVSDSMGFIKDELHEMCAHQSDDEMLLQAGACVGNYSGINSLENVRVEITEILPQLVRESVRWSFDTARLHEALSAHIQNFLTESVLSNVTRTICETEVAMGSIPSDGHGFNTSSLNSAQGKFDQTGGAHNG